jgi:serine phosphatase RsbU (regulator of sigma subunit)
MVFLVSWSAALAALGAPTLAEYYGISTDIEQLRAIPYALKAAFALFAALSFLAASRIVVRRKVPLLRSAAALKAAAGAGALTGPTVPAGEESPRRQAPGTEGAPELPEKEYREDSKLSAAQEQLRKVDELRAAESRMALRMHRRLIPNMESFSAQPEIGFGFSYIPSENTGGDIFDVVRAGKNGYALLVADVSGRGVNAALAAAMVKNAFKSRAAWNADAAAIAAAVNEELMPVLAGSEHFVTAVYATLDLENGVFRYVNAGHPPALLLRKRGSSASDLDARGEPLGLREDAVFERGERRLEEGDRILLFTDGLSSARNYKGESFGRERLAAAFAAAAREPIAAIPLAIQAELETFTAGAPHGDDIVILTTEFRSFARAPDARPRRGMTGDNYRSLTARGAALAQAGRMDEAIHAYERLLELEPDDATALNNLGALYWRAGKRAEAAELFHSASRSDPTDPRIVRNLALVHKREAAEIPAAPLRAGMPAPAETGSPAGAEEELEELEAVDEGE